MKSDIQFAADNDGNIVVTQTTVMTPREFLLIAGEVYSFAAPPRTMLQGQLPTIEDKT